MRKGLSSTPYPPTMWDKVVLNDIHYLAPHIFSFKVGIPVALLLITNDGETERKGIDDATGDDYD